MTLFSRAFRPLGLVCLMLPATVQAQSLWEDNGARVQTVAYACDGAMDDLTVAYFTAADGSSFAAMQIGGVVQAMVQNVSGSGLHYVGIDAARGFALHTKGDELLLLKKTAGLVADEEIMSRCTAEPAG